MGWDPEDWKRLRTQVTQAEGNNTSELAPIE